VGYRHFSHPDEIAKKDPPTCGIPMSIDNGKSKERRIGRVKSQAGVIRWEFQATYRLNAARSTYAHINRSKVRKYCASRSVHISFLLLYIDVKPTLVGSVGIAAHRSFRPGTRRQGTRNHGRDRCSWPRLIRVGKPACVHLDLVYDGRNLLLLVFAVLRAVAVLRALLSCAGGEKQGLQRRNASTNHSDIGLDSSPHPDLITFPGGVVGLVERVVDPVCSEAAGNDNEAADREEDDEADALRPWKSEREKRRNW
jgi:hypothetical protein